MSERGLGLGVGYSTMVMCRKFILQGQSNFWDFGPLWPINQLKNNQTIAKLGNFHRIWDLKLLSRESTVR